MVPNDCAAVRSLEELATTQHANTQSELAMYNWLTAAWYIKRANAINTTGLPHCAELSDQVIPRENVVLLTGSS